MIQQDQVFQFISSEKELHTSTLFQKLREFISSLPNRGVLVNGNGIRTVLTPEAVNKFRNSSAHLDTFTLEKAKNQDLGATD